MKSSDGTKHSLTESVHIYLRSLNDDAGDVLHFFSIVPSPSQLAYWAILVKICCGQTWLVEIIFLGIW